MTADGWPSRYIDAELRGPDPGWIETLFYHRRTLMVENAFQSSNLWCTAHPATLRRFGRGVAARAEQASRVVARAAHGPPISIKRSAGFVLGHGELGIAAGCARKVR